jgi:D-beta-D-heptose 7-phosphate kinase/D-beta-D-heptose 1-phosphate adenosyltransferase
MVKLANVLSRLNPAKILVIGDMLLDAYTMGKARRISPEAPVAIVNVYREEQRPGGAGNVILNLLSLGAEVVAIGRVGKDWAGQTFVQALEQENVDTRMIVAQEGYHTPVKNRIIADNQQIVRVDHEQVMPLNESLEQLIIDNLPQLLQEVKVVAISDYGKGFLTPTLLAATIEEAVKKGIPIITDPKGHDFQKYKGTTIIKPNLSEAFAAANLPHTAPLENVASIVLQQTQAHLLMVTRSEAGISLFDHLGTRHDFPVHAKEVKDVTGAGDTVLAMLAYAVANQLAYDEAAQLCNVAAGIAIEHVGCARITLSDLAHRLFEYKMSHKVFDQEHLFVLQEVLKRKPFSLVMLSQIDQLTHALFQSIKKIAQEAEALLVYIDDVEPREIFIEMLTSLREVNFIVLHLDSLKRLCQCAEPQAAYTFDARQARLISVDWPSYLSQQNQSLEVREIVR